ncbi:unnamed protein product [Caenorhabditis nigoni]
MDAFLPRECLTKQEQLTRKIRRTNVESSKPTQTCYKRSREVLNALVHHEQFQKVHGTLLISTFSVEDSDPIRNNPGNDFHQNKMGNFRMSAIQIGLKKKKRKREQSHRKRYSASGLRCRSAGTEVDMYWKRMIKAASKCSKFTTKDPDPQQFHWYKIWKQKNLICKLVLHEIIFMVRLKFDAPFQHDFQEVDAPDAFKTSKIF